MALEHFSIHASVVFQLGETLITDEIQALTELVKNCYDADAAKVKLTIDTKSLMPNATAFPDASSFIILEDDGFGMDLDAIRRGWLTISNSIKREIKKNGKIPVGKRTPLGDKGLGRLGAQRLGYNIEMWTRPISENVEYHVAFSWRDFSNKELLEDVPVTIEENHNPTRKHGTRIVISDLMSPAFWEGASATKNLQSGLAQMISPYGEVQNFEIKVKVNNEEIDLISIANQIRQTAQLRYVIHFDGDRLNVIGKARLDYFRTQNSVRNWFELAEVDKGDRLFAFLQSRANLKDYNLCRSDDEGWFVQFSYSQSFTEIDGIIAVGNNIPNPGPFSGEVDSINLGHNAAPQEVLSSNSEYRQLVKQLSGIRVYRDGFGIRVEDDWLGLGKQQTSGLSWYGLKPENVMGYIALSARENSYLQETTNRQDFIKNDYYYNFYKILNATVRFTGRVQEILRRSWNDYIKNITFADEPDKTPEGLSKALSENLKYAQSASKPLTTLRSTLEKTVDNARRAVQSANTGSTLFAVDEKDRQSLEKSVQDFEANAAEVNQTAIRLDDVIVNLATLEQQSHVISDQVGELKERIAETYEVVSLGITAEALTHEIFNITDGLADQTRWIRAELKKRNIVIAELITYLERVSTTISNLRKQLTHLDPSLKYLRETREKIELGVFFQEQNEFFSDRFEKNNIKILIEGDQPFYIRMNKGKLVQIFDNLFFNSEYWLKEEMRLGRLSSGIITVKLDTPYAWVSDNGPGIAQQIENSLFEPFVTLKERGRGLGLFIIKQLLNTEGCDIALGPQRNPQGRLNAFDINFTSVVSAP